VRVWRAVNAVPAIVLSALLLALVAGMVVAVNWAHWVVRKPSELLAPVSSALIKAPPATWAAYGTLFQRNATPLVSAELLAAIAQVESAGNPAAQTYWRWDPRAPDLFGVYRPASSSVGMFQMTAPALADAERFCIRDHRVVVRGTAGCPPVPDRSRLIPSDGIELAAIYLDRGVARALGPAGAAGVPAERRAELAALVHLCGPGPAGAFVRRGFRLAPGERCGDHDPAAYLAQVRSLERRFRDLSQR